jgi:hypothetical protein
MAYPTGIAPYWTENRGGLQPVLDLSTVQNHPLGTIARAQDAVLGALELIYLKGVASTVKGDAVIYDPKAGTTARAVHTTAARGLVAIAMSDCVLADYGWYAISGVVPVAAGSVNAGAPVFLTSTPGTIDDAVVSTDKVEGATTQSTDSASFAYVLLDRPSANGNG